MESIPLRNNFLSVSKDAKTIKGEKEGFLTGILYLAPVDLSGYQVCPKATKGCAAACLFSAGRGRFSRVRNARLKKTKLFFENREMFMSILYKNLLNLVNSAKKKGMIPAARLNGTSDIPWEKVSFTYENKYYRNIMEAFPEIQFYDYTKIFNRKFALTIPNYNLTFSLAEDNDADAIKALNMGMNVSVVIKCKRKAEKPSTFSGFPAIDGDKHDVRFIDKKGCIVLLRAKGKASYDKSGFVKPLDYKIKSKSYKNRIRKV
jgi:hypothetical protein